MNNNDRIEAREWHGTVVAFNRLDLNDDNVLSRAEFGAAAVNDNPVATSGDFVRVEGTQGWTDTGITVRAGDTINFDGGHRSHRNNRNDIAGVGGALSDRREANAPLPNQVAGARSRGSVIHRRSSSATADRCAHRLVGACISASTTTT